MSDFARLEAKLAKLRQKERTPGEGRRLKGNGAEALLAALVVEIDETILPRRLILTAGEASVHLAVANRRLQSMLSPAPAIEGAGALADQALPDAEEPAVQTLRAVLLTAFEGQGAVNLSARRLDTTFGSDIGVPANLLGRAWAVAEAAPAKKLAPAEVLTAFLEAIEGLAVAWLRIEGEDVTDHSGDEDQVAAVGEQAAIFLDGYFGKFEELFPADSPACGTMIAPSDDAGPAMFFAEIGDVSAFVVADPANIMQVVLRWQALIGE